MEENAESDARTRKIKKMFEDKETYSDLKHLGWLNDEVRSLYREIDEKRFDAMKLKMKIKEKNGLSMGGIDDEMILMTAAEVLFDMGNQKLRGLKEHSGFHKAKKNSEGSLFRVKPEAANIRHKPMSKRRGKELPR